MDVAKSTPRCRYSRACPTTLLAKMSPINNLSCRRFVVTKQEKPLNPYPEGTENGQTHERAAEKVTATVSVETGRGGGASREEHFEQSFEYATFFFRLKFGRPFPRASNPPWGSLFVCTIRAQVSPLSERRRGSVLSFCLCPFVTTATRHTHVPSVGSAKGWPSEGLGFLHCKDTTAAAERLDVPDSSGAAGARNRPPFSSQTEKRRCRPQRRGRPLRCRPRSSVRMPQKPLETGGRAG